MLILVVRKNSPRRHDRRSGNQQLHRLHLHLHLQHLARRPQRHPSLFRPRNHEFRRHVCGDNLHDGVWQGLP